MSGESGILGKSGALKQSTTSDRVVSSQPLARDMSWREYVVDQTVTARLVPFEAGRGSLNCVNPAGGYESRDQVKDSRRGSPMPQATNSDASERAAMRLFMGANA